MRPNLINHFSSRPVKPRKVPNELFAKAEQILDCRKNANVLCEVLEIFNKEEENYTPLLLTLELIFKSLLKRGDMYETGTENEPADNNPELIYIRWLRSNFDLGFSQILACMKKGEQSSQLQALVSCFNILIEEGRNPTRSEQGVICFPDYRLKSIFDQLLDDQQPQSHLISHLEQYSECRDFQQCGLKLLSSLKYNVRSPSDVYMQNYLELFDLLMKPGLNKKESPKQPERCHKNSEDKYLITGREGQLPLLYIFDPDLCKKYINRCWSFCMQWPLRADEKNHRRALVILVDRIMPYLTKPVLATDFLCDSLDCGSAISMISLRGILELVTAHDIDFPDIYDRLYGMFDPDMFATRAKKRLVHVADVFLSSTRVPEATIAAFAKRLSRLALVASPEDATELLTLVANNQHRHPGLKRMLRNDQPAIVFRLPLEKVPQDPYEMEESRVNATNALQSSLWEVAALKHHFTPEVCDSAAKVLALGAAGARPPSLTPPPPPPPCGYDEVILSVFTVVTFPNGGCAGASGDNGTCLAARECSARGGSANGYCANGFGLCCICMTSCGSSTSENGTYFVNSGYPSSYDGTGSCDLTVIKSHPDVCQIRLDFNRFTIAGPEPVNNVCNQDQFIVSGGNPVPAICGINQGSHMYIDAGVGSTNPVKLTFVTSGAAFARMWKVKVTQIPCSTIYRADEGCLQYYTGVSGQLKSFNYDTASGLQLSNQDYGICIRMERNFCGIQYSACPDTVNNRSRAFTISGNSNGPVNAMVGSGAGPNACANDWLLVPCASNVGRVQPAQALCTDRICGGTFSAELSMQASTVMSTVKPFRLWFHADNVEAPLDIANRGFCLNYIQQPCTNNVI